LKTSEYVIWEDGVLIAQKKPHMIFKRSLSASEHTDQWPPRNFNWVLQQSYGL